MKKLSRYTILNLESCPERWLLAYENALRDGVPKKRIHFWTGLDFETLDKLLARDDWTAMEALFIRKNHENDWYWSPAGAYTTAFPIVKRSPIKVVGSDTENGRIGLFEIEANGLVQTESKDFCL